MIKAIRYKIYTTEEQGSERLRDYLQIALEKKYPDAAIDVECTDEELQGLADLCPVIEYSSPIDREEQFESEEEVLEFIDRNIEKFSRIL